MSTNVYSKNDILQKLASEGFFVDFLTLDSFLAKYKLEAIFEDEDGNEFYDSKVYDTLVENVLRRPKKEEVQEVFDEAETICTVDEVQNEEQPETQVQTEEETYTASEGGLGNIKWHDWREVSADLVPKSEQMQENTPVVEQIVETEVQIQNDEPLETQQDYWQSPKIDISDENIEPEIVEEELLIQEPEPSIMPSGQEIVSDEVKEVVVSDETEEDFDDIGLLSDSIQAQEKFQNYIVNELAKKNIDLTPKVENAFKFDISEKTLNMIARAIAKKIARQVSMIFSAEAKNNEKLVQIEKKNELLEAKLAQVETQNKKLKLLLLESNKNLNSYKPTLFGLYKFVRKKSPKKKR